MCRYDEKSAKKDYSEWHSCKCYEPNKRKCFNYKEVKSVIFRDWTAGRKFYKKEFLVKNNLLWEKGVYYEDVLFHVQCFYLAQKITILDEPLYFYRIRPESIMTGKYTIKKIDDVFHFLSAVKDFLEQNNLFEFLKGEYIDFATDQINFHYTRQTTLKKYFIHQMEIFFNSYKDDLPKDLYQDILKAGHKKIWKKVKYKNGKKVTRYFGGIIKKVKGEKSKKIYLFGVQIFHKRKK
jgi:hypothetical protein